MKKIILQPDLPNLWLDIQVADSDNQRRILLKALIDTGFDGFITIPEKFADKLHLDYLGTIHAEFAGGFQGKVEVVSGLVTIPDLDLNTKWDLEIILDENNEDILLEALS